MELNTWLIYLGVISTLIFFPGPSAVICMSHGLRHGRGKGFATVLGGAFAALLLMGVSVIGLGTVLAASTTAFMMVKLLGAGYLIYLGIKALTDNNVHFDCPTQTFFVNQTFVSLFNKGFMVGISNPKDLLFFAALFPSFIDPSAPHIPQYTVLAITWFFVDVGAMFTYVCLGTQVNRWFSESNHLQVFNRIVGGVFISTGAALAISSVVGEES